MLRRGPSWFPKALEEGRFDRVLSGRDEEERWERFALRTANTPGRTRVVLRLAMQNDDGSMWYMWASYKFEDGDQYVETAQLVLDTIFISDPEHDDPLALPGKLEGEAIFEAEG